MTDDTAQPGDSGIPPPTALPGADDRLDRVDGLAFGPTTAIAFVGYWFTLAPNLTLEYSGLMSTGAMYAGVPHVPGYPVWTLYSWVFTKLLPFSNIAWRVAVGSAVASAIACGLVALMVSRCGSILFAKATTFVQPDASEQAKLRVVCGTVAGLVLAFAGVVWRNAVVADIWALSLLLFVAVIASLLRWMLSPAKRWFLALALFLLGLLLTSSQEMIVVFPGIVVAIMVADPRLGRDAALFLLPLAAAMTSFDQYGVWISFLSIPNQPLVLTFAVVMLIGLALAVKTRRIGTEWRDIFVCGGAFLLGLAFYFYVPIASMTTPPVNWGYPRTVEGFLHVIGRGQFERLDPIPLCDPFQFWEVFSDQCWTWAAVVGSEFGWPELLIALIPFCFLGQIRPMMRCWLLALVAIGFGVGPMLLAELNPPDHQAQRLVAHYFVATYAVLAVWLGLGLFFCGSLFANEQSHNALRTL